LTSCPHRRNVIEVNPPPRLDEVPTLIDRGGEFHGLYVDDVIINQATVKGEVVGWMANVILVNNRTTGWPTPLIWAIGLRDTEEEAREAALALLEGLLAGAERALEKHPADIPDLPTVKAMEGALSAAVDQWNGRRNQNLQRHVEYVRRRKLADVPPREVVEWGALVSNTRKRWGMKQIELARRVGLDQPRLSKIENGKLDPPFEMMYRICDVLDLEPPERSDG